MPLQRAAAEAVNASALAAGGGGRRAPEVVVDGVNACGRAVPLAAEVGALGESRGRGGGRRQGDGRGAGQRNESGELHGDDVERDVERN